MSHFIPKNCTDSLITLDLLEGFFLKSCTIKGANSSMKMILVILPKKIRGWGGWGGIGPFWTQNGASSQLWFGCKSFLEILLNKKGQQVDESNNNGLYQKKFVQDKWAILGPKMAHPHNSGSALRIFLKFCRMKGANRYMKIL